MQQHPSKQREEPSLLLLKRSFKKERKILSSCKRLGFAITPFLPALSPFPDPEHQHTPHKPSFPRASHCHEPPARAHSTHHTGGSQGRAALCTSLQSPRALLHPQPLRPCSLPCKATRATPQRPSLASSPAAPRLCRLHTVCYLQSWFFLIFDAL